jgi:PAS domain S-box-containing protein
MLTPFAKLYAGLLRILPIPKRLREWWNRQAPHRQDRYAMLAPLVAVFFFFTAIVVAVGYLRIEEMEREQEALRRDVEYAQQRLRLRLLERQEDLARLAQQLSNQELSPTQFRQKAEVILHLYPEIQGLSWVAPASGRAGSPSGAQSSERFRLRASQGYGPAAQALTAQPIPQASPSLAGSLDAYVRARELHQPAYASPWLHSADGPAWLSLFLPLQVQSRFGGVLLAEYSIDALYDYSISADVSARYATSLRNANGQVLAGSRVPRPKAPTGGNGLTAWLGWAGQAEQQVLVSPAGTGLVLHAQAYRASQGLIGSSLFWLVTVLSVMTAWMLIANWRHTRRRVQAQRALLLETSFRRAMENSMPTGMRALDPQGRITYVNAAFCQMTGWSEQELVGAMPPFPFWPEDSHELLAARLEDELQGRITSSGLQVRIQRKDGSLFDARIHVSPLIDANGQQTGWMTSMTDITEPNRVREQLYASYERFTTVLEALDASVSVAPLGGGELLFANKMYRLWFGDQNQGHVQLSSQAGHGGMDTPAGAAARDRDNQDAVDDLAGLPASSLLDAVEDPVEAENAEIHVETLDKWLEVRTRYLTWVDGRLAQMVIATDITPRRMAEEQAAAQAERAQTANRLITMGEMASSIAHELNQPLAAITNYCNGMISRIQSRQIAEEDLLGALDKTSRQAQRAGQIIQRIRAFVKRSEPKRVAFEAGELVDEAIELAEIELRRNNVRLTRQIAEGLPPLMVDPILIEQVLINLLKNAAEAIVQARRPLPQRRIDLQIQAGEVEGRPVVEFIVTDRGHGIAPEMMDHLYEAFHTTKAGGMGIGLSLCRSIVESHQGRMRAENLYNGPQAGTETPEVVGCRFSFWLPLEPEPAREAITTRGDRPPSPSTPEDDRIRT